MNGYAIRIKRYFYIREVCYEGNPPKVSCVRGFFTSEDASSTFPMESVSRDLFLEIIKEGDELLADHAERKRTVFVTLESGGEGEYFVVKGKPWQKISVTEVKQRSNDN